jgi:hypothetical protein
MTRSGYFSAARADGPGLAATSLPQGSCASSGLLSRVTVAAVPGREGRRRASPVPGRAASGGAAMVVARVQETPACYRRFRCEILQIRITAAHPALGDIPFVSCGRWPAPRGEAFMAAARARLAAARVLPGARDPAGSRGQPGSPLPDPARRSSPGRLARTRDITWPAAPGSAVCMRRLRRASASFFMGGPGAARRWPWDQGAPVAVCGRTPKRSPRRESPVRGLAQRDIPGAILQLAVSARRAAARCGVPARAFAARHGQPPPAMCVR